MIFVPSGWSSSRRSCIWRHYDHPKRREVATRQHRVTSHHKLNFKFATALNWVPCHEDVWGNGGISKCVIDRGSRWSWVDGFLKWCSTLRVTATSIRRIKGWVGPTDGLDAASPVCRLRSPFFYHGLLHKHCHCRVQWQQHCAYWLRHCATSRKAAGSIPDEVIEIFHWHNLSGRTMAPGSIQPLKEMSTGST
jgi:hypothetical protein